MLVEVAEEAGVESVAEEDVLVETSVEVGAELVETSVEVGAVLVETSVEVE